MKVGVSAAADHPYGALEQDARLDGESSSDDYRGGTKRLGAGVWVTHKHIHTLQQFTIVT